MKNCIKKYVATGLVIISVLGNTFSTVAQDTTPNEVKETINSLRNGYTEYYDILNTKVTLYSSHEVEKYIKNRYLLEMTVVLKADEVEDMDYYKGVVEYYDKAMISDEKTKVRSQIGNTNMIAAECKKVYNELEQYIGKEQELVFIIEETYPISDEKK